jgi:hypothetical protein
LRKNVDKHTVPEILTVNGPAFTGKAGEQAEIAQDETEVVGKNAAAGKQQPSPHCKNLVAGQKGLRREYSWQS